MDKIYKKINYVRRIGFSNLFETFITLFFISFISVCMTALFKWLFFKADWAVIRDNLSLYIFGVFPSDQLWRPALWLFTLLVLTAITLSRQKLRWIRKSLPIAWISAVPLGLYLLSGGLGLSPIASRYWGGLTLTIFLTASSGLIAFPLGMILAIGRQSEYSLIKYLSGIYIDGLRAVPLIAILFFGQLLIPLFLPYGLEINRVLRAVIAFALFVSAYVAEDIRGGLQAISKSQIEAAKSLGLSDFQIKQFIVLPQAITIALPALANQAIGLLQNTSLMAILGLVELLGISRSILANPDFIGSYTEVYVWLAVIYWLVCTVMALLSRHLEQRLTIEKSNP
tara:strand:- start:1627 stop:2646 length:1020 start_codon:yes stop_codon:yes gene_type:complete